MAILPTRTSADVNAAGDINELSSEALDKGGTSQLSALTEIINPAKDDIVLVEKASDGSLVGYKISSIKKSGIIKSSTSVVNNTTLTSISDWSGSAGAYTSTITLTTANAYAYVNNMSFSRLDGTDYVHVEPSEKRATSTTAIQITMPVNDDLYIGIS